MTTVRGRNATAGNDSENATPPDLIYAPFEVTSKRDQSASVINAGMAEPSRTFRKSHATYGVTMVVSLMHRCGKRDKVAMLFEGSSKKIPHKNRQAAE